MEKYRSGNEGVFKFFVGQVMRETRGQANPQLVNEVVKRMLDADELTPAGSHVLKEGDRAPDFQALTDDESPISLAGFRGKNVILYFFPKANTPG